jgi:hypothetical protein
MEGDALIADLRRASPDVRVLVLSASLYPEGIEKARRTGADEILDKSTPWTRSSPRYGAWGTPESPETSVHARTALGHKAHICDRYCLISPKRSERSPVGKAPFTGLRGRGQPVEKPPWCPL